MPEIYERVKNLERERDKITQRIEELAQDLDALNLGPIQQALGKIAQIRPELDTKIGTERLKATETEIAHLSQQVARVGRRLDEIPEMRYVQRRLGEIEKILKKYDMQDPPPDTQSIGILEERVREIEERLGRKTPESEKGVETTVDGTEMVCAPAGQVRVTFSDGKWTLINLDHWYAIKKLFTEEPNE